MIDYVTHFGVDNEFMLLHLVFVYEKKWVGLIFGLTTLIIAILNYTKDQTMWSMWCWSVNSIMIYYAIYLLIYLPFLEKMDIC